MRVGIVVCDYCGIEYEKSLRHIKYNAKLGHKNFCSLACQRNGKRKGSIGCCSWCGKQIYVEVARISKSKTGNVFCCKSCSTSYTNKHIKCGENHPNWNDGKGSYRARALNKENKCAVCGYDKVTHVHHIDEDRNNNNLDNLITLCPNHHYEIHYGVSTLKELLEHRE